MSGRASRALAVLAVGAATIAASWASGASDASARQSASPFEFRPVISMVAPAPSPATTLAPADRVKAGVSVGICDRAAVEQLPVVPTTRWRLAKPGECVVYPDRTNPRGARYFLGTAATLPMRSAKPEFVAGQGWTVKLTFTRAGSKAWDELARQQFHEQIAITYRGTVVSAPVIQPDAPTFTSYGGTAVVSGAFSEKEAVALAAAIRSANGR